MLSDFYSQLVVTEDGRFNLRDVARKDAAPTPPVVSRSGDKLRPSATRRGRVGRRQRTKGRRACSGAGQRAIGDDERGAPSCRWTSASVACSWSMAASTTPID